MSGVVVVDTSLALKWIVREEDSASALGLLNAWDRENRQPVGPHLLPLEITNSLHRRVVKGEMGIQTAAYLIERLFTQVEIHSAPDLHRRALELASELGQGASYDAHYLALAEALECEYWTADERFWRAAGAIFDTVHLLGEVGAPH